MSEPRPLPVTLGQLQLIVGGLMSGVVALLAVALVVRPPAPHAFAATAARMPWLALLVVAVAGAAVLVIVLGRLLEGRVRAEAVTRDRPEGEYLPGFATWTVVRGALVEGIGLLGVVAYLAVGVGAGLVTAAASFLGLLALFPTAARHEAFVDRVTRPE